MLDEIDFSTNLAGINGFNMAEFYWGTQIIQVLQLYYGFPKIMTDFL